MKKKGFQFLWIGQSLANFGDVLYIVGLMALIYRLTGSAGNMAIVPFLSTASRFISALIAPIILDRLGLKGALVSSQFCKTFLLFLFSFLSLLPASAQNVIIIFAFVVLISFLDGWATPARSAMVPLLVSEHKLMAANSFLSMLDQTMAMSGWALGGLLAARFGASFLIGVTLVLFCLSSFCMVLIRIVNRCPPEKDDDERSKWARMKEGWLTVWHTPALRVIFAIDSLCSLADVVWIAAIIYVFVDQALHVDSSWWGYINFSFFAGLMLASFFGVRWSETLNKHSASVATTGTLLTGIMTLIFGMNTLPILALILTVVYGITVQFKTIVFLTIEQKCAPPDQLAKVYAAQDALLSILFGFGSLLFGFLADYLGVRSVFFLSALLLITAFFLLLTWGKNLNRQRVVK